MLLLVLVGIWFLLTLWAIMYTPKKTYRVKYLRIGFCQTECAVFMKARSLVEIQKKLDKKESPWTVRITSVEVV